MTKTFNNNPVNSTPINKSSRVSNSSPLNTQGVNNTTEIAKKYLENAKIPSMEGIPASEQERNKITFKNLDKSLKIKAIEKRIQEKNHKEPTPFSYPISRLPLFYIPSPPFFSSLYPSLHISRKLTNLASYLALFNLALLQQC